MKRKIATVLLLILVAISAHAQDIVTNKKGEDLKCKVTEVTPSEIKYQMYNGRKVADVIYTMAKSDVLMITYDDGRRDVFANDAPATQNNTTPIVNNSVVKAPMESSVSNIDKMYLHNGNTIDGIIIRVDNYTIVYKYQGETSEQVIGKYAVDKLVHSGTGRVEKITDKIVVNSARDWESVVILEDKSYITGLTKVDEIGGHSSWWSYSSANKKDKKAIKKLKAHAASMGCPFILLTTSINDRSQDIRNGLGYKY